MELEKSVMLQKQVRDNSEDLQSEFLDMKNWEEQMRRKDEELQKEASGEIVIPPIRSKKKKNVKTSDVKQSETTVKSKRIKSYDYASWEKFDVDKACKEVDKEEETDDSEEEVKSKEELEKAHEEATKHKQEGNIFVQQQKWDKAITCYNKAIKAFPYDAVFYANRALCQIKLDNLYSAEADCSTAIQLDETYVKAYHRRATARMGLKQYKEALQDLEKILKLEPSNKEAKSLLAQVEKKIESSKPIIMSDGDTVQGLSIEKKIGEKMWSGTKPSTQSDSKKDCKEDIKRVEDVRNVKEANVQITKINKRDPRIPEWLPEKDDVAIIEPIEKPPHLRSKKPLTKVPVEEVEFGITDRKKNDRVEFIEEQSVKPEIKKDDTSKEKNGFVKVPEATHDITEIPSVPKTAVQFLMHWKKNKSLEFRYKYLKQLPASDLPNIFRDSLESDILVQILDTLRLEFTKNKESVYEYLKALSEVKRFRALIMFFSNSEKEGLKTLFEYCKLEEKISEEEVTKLREQYEL